MPKIFFVLKRASLLKLRPVLNVVESEVTDEESASEFRRSGSYDVIKPENRF